MYVMLVNKLSTHPIQGMDQYGSADQADWS